VELESAIVEFGTEAVKRYREISKAEHDNEVPEVFLGGFIAQRLFDRFHCGTHVERFYTVMAKELGIDVTKDLLNEFGGFRADLAVYEERLPFAIIELKILDEGQRPASVAADLAKAQKIVRLSNLHAYAGVMICQTMRDSLEVRIRDLERILNGKVRTGPKCEAVGGGWHWCFGCALVPKT
jgi:hypothetical protein